MKNIYILKTLEIVLKKNHNKYKIKYPKTISDLKCRIPYLFDFYQYLI